MIVDAFTFYNELDVLELRLKNTDAYVDKWVLVEADKTHSGVSKELFFENNKERFAKWIPKITHIIVRDMPDSKDPWAREKYQRHCILNGLEGLPDDTIIMVSDVDEIPDMKKVTWDTIPSVIHMWMFEYSFDYMFTNEPWFGTVIATYDILKKYGPNQLRSNRWSLHRQLYAGWHLSSFGNAHNLVNKITTYAHHADVGIFPDMKNVETFQNLIQNGLHHDGKTKLTRTPANVPLPENIE